MAPLATEPDASVLIVTEDGEGWMAEGLRHRLSVHRPCELRTASAVRAADVPWIASRGLTFVRSRSVRLLATLERVEHLGGTVVNSVAAIRAARERAVAIARVAAAGVPTARDFEGPLADLPFEDAVLKSRFDSGRGGAVRHRRRGAAGRRAERRVYAQELLPGAWEHKLYLVGDEAFAFVQRPTLAAPDKLATRRREVLDPRLEDLARRAAAAVGLAIAGVDFVEDAAGLPRVTDVNSNQGLHTFDEGHASLERYLLRRLSDAR